VPPAHVLRYGCLTLNGHVSGREDAKKGSSFAACGFTVEIPRTILRILEDSVDGERRPRDGTARANSHVIGSSWFARQERISVDLEQSSLVLAARTFERIDRRSDLDFNEPDVFQHFLPGCARQTTGDSGRPKINVLNGRLGDWLAIGDVRKLQSTAGPKNPIDFRKGRLLVGTQVDYAIAYDDIRPSVLYR
jgi:hypothetical protein